MKRPQVRRRPPPQNLQTKRSKSSPSLPTVMYASCILTVTAREQHSTILVSFPNNHERVRGLAIVVSSERPHFTAKKTAPSIKSRRCPSRRPINMWSIQSSWSALLSLWGNVRSRKDGSHNAVWSRQPRPEFMTQFFEAPKVWPKPPGTPRKNTQQAAVRFTPQASTKKGWESLKGWTSTEIHQTRGPHDRKVFSSSMAPDD